MLHELKSSLKLADGDSSAEVYGPDLFGKFLESSQNEIFIIDDKSLHFVHANAGACRNAGYTVDELRDRTLFDLVEEQSSEAVDDFLWPLRSGEKEILRFETYLKRRDGSRYPVDINLQIFTDRKPHLLVAVALDITERKKATGLNERFDRIFESSLNEIYVFDGATCRFQNVNNGAQKNLGYTMDELEGMTAWDIKPHIDEPSFREMVAPLIAGDVELLQFETVHQRKDGTTYPVEVHLQYFMDEDPALFVAIILDITERARAAEIESRFGRIFESSLNEIYVFDGATLRFENVNKQARENLGYSKAELQNMVAWDVKVDTTVWDIEPHVDESRFREDVAELVSGEVDLLQFETVHRRKDGTTYPIEFLMQYFPDDGPGLFVATGIDITERKNAMGLSARFDRIFESSLNEIYMFDGTTCRFQNVNVGAQKNLGYSMDELKDMTAWDIKPLVSQEQFQDMVAPLISGDTELLKFETVHQRKDGTTYPVEVHLQYFMDENPAIFVAIILDITERQDAEAEIRELNQSLEDRVRKRTSELRRSNEELSEAMESLQLAQNQLVESEKMASLGGLVAGVAHEINTPVGIGVTAVTHLLESVTQLQRKYDDDTIRRSDFEEFVKSSSAAAHIIFSNLQRASELIRSFKTVAVDQTSEDAREFNMSTCIEEILMSLHPKLKQTKVAMSLNCSADIVLFGRPGVFYQIVNNLVMNSLIHAYEPGEEGALRIEVKEEDGRISFVYSDDGAGMPPEHVQKIFEPFFTTRRGEGGSGLGMHVIYNLVTQVLGGRIACKSAVGEGTRFEISFPVDATGRHKEGA